MWQREEGGRRRGKGDKENGWMGECGACEVRDELNKQSEECTENTRKQQGLWSAAALGNKCVLMGFILLVGLKGFQIAEATFTCMPHCE